MNKKLTWFPVYGNTLGAVEEMKLENVGHAFISALKFFNDGEIPQAGSLNAEEKILFGMLQQGIKDAREYSAEISAKRADAARKRWEKERGE